MTAPAQPLARAGRGAPGRALPSRAPLTVVRPAPSTRTRKGPFVILLLALLGAGLLGLLLLNLALMENSFQANTLRNKASELGNEEQALSVQADQLSDPAALAGQAARYGMVPGGAPAEYLPAGSPLPPGARILAREPGSGAVLIVVPPPAAGQNPGRPQAAGEAGAAR